MDMDDKTRMELEAAAYRRLLEHLRQRTDVQNIDLMNLAGFCRNCLVQLVRGCRKGAGRSRHARGCAPDGLWHAL